MAQKTVKLDLNKEKRSLMCQLRCGTLPLALELGRFLGIPRKERLCPICCKNEVETELHFLFECQCLQEVRIRLYHKCPEVLQFPNVVNRLKYLCKKPYVLGNYISNLWQERQKLLLK